MFVDGDVPVVDGLRKMIKEARRKFKTESRAADQSAKWLDWPQLLEATEQLRLECAGRTHLGQYRRASAVAWSLQRFLIFAILTSVPGVASLSEIIKEKHEKGITTREGALRTMPWSMFTPNNVNVSSKEREGTARK